MINRKQCKSYLVLLSTSLIVASSLLSGCTSKGGMYQPPGKPPIETVNFSITFDLKGNPIVVDRDGKLISPKRIEFPITEVRAIGSLKTISAMEVHGSHYYVLNISGDTYHIPLPGPHPAPR